MPPPPRPKHFQAYLEARSINGDALWPSHEDARAKFALERLAVHTKCIERLRLAADEVRVAKAEDRANRWLQFNAASLIFDTTVLVGVRSWLLRTRADATLDAKFDHWQSLPPKASDAMGGVVDSQAKAEVDVVTAIWAPWPGKSAREQPLTVNRATHEKNAVEVLALRDEHYKHQAELRDESETRLATTSLLEIFKHERPSGQEWSNHRLSVHFQTGIAAVLNARLCLDEQRVRPPRKKRCGEKKKDTTLDDLLRQ